MKKTIAMLTSAMLCMTIFAGCGAPASPAPANPDAAEVSSDAALSTPDFAPDSTPEAGPAGKGDPQKKVILVVSFGTSYNDSRDATIGAVEKAIADAFPDYELRRAFTSQIIIDKLKSRDGLEIDNVTEAMERLISDGVGTLVVQPTHVMNGSEYDDMVAEIAPYADRFETLRFGTPLLTSTEDYKNLAAAISGEFEVPDDTALVLMGHGTEHFANCAYAALAYHFLDNGCDNILVGTVEGYPDLEDTMRNVQALGVKKVILTPLMVVAGDHANNDMAGDEEDSWKTQFKAAGYEVDCVLKGMGEYESIRALYVEHVRRAIEAPAEEA